jgi:hypothetical protein
MTGATSGEETAHPSEAPEFTQIFEIWYFLLRTDVNIHASIAKYGIDIQIVRPEMTKFKMFRELSKHRFLFCGNYILKFALAYRVSDACIYQ